MRRYFITVHGRVQGVGFRYFADYTAKTFDLTGWVRNYGYDTVQIEVQGKEGNIVMFIDKIRIGNRFSNVEDIHVEEIDTILKEKNFKVIY